LVLRPEALPPDGDELEDWVWLPSDERDLAARLNALLERAAMTAAADVAVPPLTHGLTSLQRRLATSLLVEVGALVTHEALGKAGWADAPSASTLRAAMRRLRCALAHHGYDIAAVRGRGYVLYEAANAE
jgi:DNA-binding response OmpR family regulator